MRLHLQRLYEQGESLFGLLTGPGDLVLHTVERCWMGNEPNLSCVPAGFYVLEPFDSPRHGDTFALVGDSVSAYQETVRRSSCIFHAANWGHELKGCIAPGTHVARISDELAVAESAKAMTTLLRVLARQGPHYLTIEGDQKWTHSKR